MLWSKAIGAGGAGGGGEPWDITAAVLADSFDVSAESAFPQDIAFHPDGTKVYMLESGSIVNQYELSVPWSIGTATFAKIRDFSASATGAVAMSFKVDGTKIYLFSSTNSIYEYNLTTAWDIGTASSFPAASKAISNPSAAVRSIAFKEDGTQVYFLSNSTDAVKQYGLNTPWSVSTINITNQTFSVVSEDGNMYGLTFSPDGLKMFTTGLDGDAIYRYNLSVAWSVNSSVYSNSFIVSAEDTTPFGVRFKPDGTKMYVLGGLTDTIYEYNLTA